MNGEIISGLYNINRSIHKAPKQRESMKRIFAILTLIVFSILFSEVLTGSTPVYGFLNAGVSLLLFLGYGCAVLIIREISMRWKFGIVSILLLGIGFGIYNEGMLAQTLIKETNLPVSNFNFYSYHYGINIAFSITISLWHAFFSVLLPILLVHQLYPTFAQERWLSNWLMILLSIVVFVLLPVGVAKVKDQRMIIFTVAIVFLVASAFLTRKQLTEGKHRELRWKQLLIGLGIYFSLLFFPNFLAVWNAPTLIYVLYSFGLLALLLATAVFLRLSQRIITFYGMGVYIGGILVSIIFSAISGNLLQVLTSIVLGCFVIYLGRRIKNSSSISVKN